MSFNRHPRSSHFSAALAGSLALHALFMAVTWQQPAPPVADQLIEIDLRDAEKATPKPQPTVALEPTSAPSPAPTAAPTEEPTAEATREPVPTLPPAAQPVLPTPQPTSEAEPTAVPVSEPTPVPQSRQPKATIEPTPVPRPTARPRPTIPVDRPRAVPTVAPQPKATVATAPTPEPTEETPRPRPANARPPTRSSSDDGNSPRTNLSKRPQPFAGANRAPQPGSGRARNRNAARSDEQAGDRRDRFSASSSSSPRNRFQTNRADPFAERDAARDAGGQSDAPDVSLPSGVRSARRDAGRTDLDAGDQANRAFGRGNPGGSVGSGRPGAASSNGRDGGSTRGRNPELADSSGAGGITLPRFPRSGGQSTLGGRRDDLFAINDPNARDSRSLARNPEGPGMGPSSGGRDRGAGRNRGAGVGNENDGPTRSALRTRPGSGLGASDGNRIGGAPGRGRRGSGEIAGTGGFGGNGARGDGGSGGGRGSNRGNGNGGGGGGYRPRVAGVPFGDPFGSGRGNPSGGGGQGGGPGGPGQGPRLARRGSGDGGDGSGNGDGGNGAGRFPGRGGRGGAGGGGRGFGPGAGAGNTSGDGGRGAGGGDGGGGSGTGGIGRGRRGRGSGGDDEAGGGRGGDGDGARLSRLALERGKLKRGREEGREIGRGIWNPGLVGTFYQDPDRGILEPGHKIDWPTLGAPGSKFVRRHTSKTIDFDWGLDAPLPGVRGTYWSVKWTGRIFVPKTDDYRFFLDDVDDGGRLYLDGKKIIDVWLVQKSSPGSGTMRLEKGAHQITLEYVQGPATASSVRLMWESSSFPRELVGAYIPGGED